MIRDTAYLPKEDRPALVVWVLWHGMATSLAICASAAGQDWLPLLGFLLTVVPCFAMRRWLDFRKARFAPESRRARPWAWLAALVTAMLTQRVGEWLSKHSPEGFKVLTCAAFACWFGYWALIAIKLWGTSDRLETPQPSGAS